MTNIRKKQKVVLCYSYLWYDILVNDLDWVIVA